MVLFRNEHLVWFIGLCTFFTRYSGPCKIQWRKKLLDFFILKPWKKQERARRLLGCSKNACFVCLNYHPSMLKKNSELSLFSSKSQTFGLGQFISTHFGTVSPLSMFSYNQPLFLQKNKPLYPHSRYFFAIGIWIWISAAKN